MLRAISLFTALVFATLPVLAQQGGKESKPEAPPRGTTVLNSSTQLVQLDVVVTDSNGNVVHDLKAGDFQVQEDKKPQTVRDFEETRVMEAGKLAAAPIVKLSPGTFTDYSPVPDKAPLTVLLIDRLNTAPADQNYMQQQLRSYLLKAPANSRIAIFDLTTRLNILQGFTTDPSVLRAAVEKNVPQSSPLLPDNSSNDMAQLHASLGASNAMLGQFSAEEASSKKQDRVRYTLGNFNQLAAYLSSFPGRKNVVWFSGSFPISIEFDPTIPYGFNTQADFTDQLRQTTNLLARSRIAVYPVEAGGLSTSSGLSETSIPMYGPVRSAIVHNQAADRSVNEFHESMKQLANDTGGHAFYNNNDLAGAVQDAIKHGSQYYTLTYSPTNKDPREGFRSIRVELTGPAASRHLKLAYRKGYYTLGNKPVKSFTTDNAGVTLNVDSAALAAMQHGAPTPSEILFKVRVLPMAEPPPSESARQTLKVSGMKYFAVDFTALANRIEMPIASDGNHHGLIEFVTFVFDADGKRLGVPIARSLNMNLTPDNFANLTRSGIAFSENVPAPPRATYLRFAIHDLNSNRMGVVEVPLTEVSKLSPVPAVPSP